MDYTRVEHKKHSSTYNEKKTVKYLRALFKRVLLSIILVLSVGIFIKSNAKNQLLVNEYLFEDSIKFTKINKWYQDKIGKIIPDIKTESEVLVFSSDELKKNEFVKYKDGVKISLQKSCPISILNGGIVIFAGEKDDYGNTIIIQGNDGKDYWYGNITNLNVTLYDYVEKDTLIGEASDDFIYLILQKDGKYLNYEEYLNKI